MRYLVIPLNKNQKPFFTNWFDSENHFNKEQIEMVVDLINHEYTTDGKQWHLLLVMLPNGSRLCEAVDFEKQMFNLKQKIKWKTKAQN